MNECKLKIKATEEISQDFLEQTVTYKPVKSVFCVESDEQYKKRIEKLAKECWVSVESLKQLLRKEREKHKQIENSTASDLWREGARWNIRLIDELLGLLEKGSES